MFRRMWLKSNMRYVPFYAVSDSAVKITDEALKDLLQ